LVSHLDDGFSRSTYRRHAEIEDMMKHGKMFNRVGCLFSRGEKNKRASRHGSKTCPADM
jgi:hypothetical protein